MDTNLPVNLPAIQAPCAKRTGKKHGTVFWILFIVPLIVAVVGGAYVQSNFWTG